MRSTLRLSLLVVIAWFPTRAYAQQTLDYPSSKYETYRHSSGPVANLADDAGLSHQHVVQFPGASWLRLYFSDVELKKGSYLRVTSVLDNETQISIRRRSPNGAIRPPTSMATPSAWS
jgi:hypothetical protein